MVEPGRAPVCAACIARLTDRSLQDFGTLCTRCGETLAVETVRFATGIAGGECMACRLAPPEFRRAVAFANYDEETREVLHLLKFGGVRAAADFVLGEGMATAILKLEGEAATNLVVVPVPLFGARQRSRGFNQAELLANAGVTRLRVLRPSWNFTVQPDALQRVKDTRAQFALAPHVRRKNLRGAFRVKQSATVEGKEVLLVDDILTTGATARECARVLLKAGAVKVWVATYARAQVDGRSARRPEIAMWDMQGEAKAASDFGSAFKPAVELGREPHNKGQSNSEAMHAGGQNAKQAGE